MRGFHHVVVGQAPAETAAAADHVHVMSLCSNAQRPGGSSPNAPVGIWLVDQISNLPSLKSAVQFCGSSGACEMNG